MKSQKGFSLLELMIAVALIGILTAIAIPSYRNYVQRSARANAEADLISAAGAMERRKSQNFSYTGATAGTANTDTFSSVSPVDATSGNQKYDITLWSVDSTGTATAVTSPATFPAGITAYEIRATSNAGFVSGNQTEVLKINQLGQKCYKQGASVTNCTIGGTTPDPTWP